MPLVSIIIPAYNPGSFLPIAIESVYAQTFTDWEIILVDDGSTEDLSYVISNYPEIRFIRQENRGLSIARNVAIIASTSQYIAFLDADDVWLPNKLENQVKLMEKNDNYAMCQTQFEIIDATGNKLSEGYAHSISSYAEMMKGCGICISSVLVLRRCLAVSGLFDPFLQSTQDYDMWLKLSRYYDMAFVDSTETQYRWHSQNMSHSYQRTYYEMRNLFHIHLKSASGRGDKVAVACGRWGLSRVNMLYAGQALDHSRASLRRLAVKSLLSHLFFACKRSPRSVINFLLLFLKNVWRKSSENYKVTA